MIVFWLAFHDFLGNGINLVVHQELFFFGELHDDDAKVGSSQVKGQELSLFAAIGQVPHISRETLDARLHLALFLQPFLCELQEKTF